MGHFLNFARPLGVGGSFGAESQVLNRERQWIEAFHLGNL